MGLHMRIYVGTFKCVVVDDLGDIQGQPDYVMRRI